VEAKIEAIFVRRKVGIMWILRFRQYRGSCMKTRDDGQHGLICSRDLACHDIDLTWFSIGLGLVRSVHNNITVDDGRSRATVKSEDLIVERLNSEPRWVLLVMRERLSG
jgi:hypothetical protein